MAEEAPIFVASPGSYGSSSEIATFVIGPDGRLTSAGTSAIELPDLSIVSGVSTVAGTSATINAATGRFRLAAAATAFTLTNSHILAVDTVLGIPAQNDATGILLNIVPGAGSAVFNFVAPTANMDVSFLVVKNV